MVTISYHTLRHDGRRTFVESFQNWNLTDPYRVIEFLATVLNGLQSNDIRQV